MGGFAKDNIEVTEDNNGGLRTVMGKGDFNVKGSDSDVRGEDLEC